MRRRSIICARGGESLLLNCGYGHGYSVLELLDAVQQRLRPHARHPRPRPPRRRRAGDDRRRRQASARRSTGSRATTTSRRSSRTRSPGKSSCRRSSRLNAHRVGPVKFGFWPVASEDHARACDILHRGPLLVSVSRVVLMRSANGIALLALPHRRSAALITVARTVGTETASDAALSMRTRAC